MKNGQPTGELLERLRSRILDGKCLHCENSPTRRGLCVTCYWAFRRMIRGKPRLSKKLIESRSIREGKILPPNFARQVKRPNPFNESR